jgi:nucleoside-diphosphate-sugar epimerase
MPAMLIFGLGYTAGRLADRLRVEGWVVTGTRRLADEAALAFEDEDAVRVALAAATHVLSSVPPGADGRDPVIARYGHLIGSVPWIGYLSSTGVYGDTGGAWVDEGAPIGGGRRTARVEADHAWEALWPESWVFRLPGIYGPGRSAIERVQAGSAHRVDRPGQVFSRVHVDDIVAGVIAALDAPPGAYNLADDRPASQNDVIEEASRLLGLPPPPFVDLAALSPMARGFYAENRRVANGKAKRLLGWRPRFADYRAGLVDCYRAFARRATTSPAIASAAPKAAEADQR